MHIVAVACPVPLRSSFDYAVSPEQHERLLPGMRVSVPFGRRELIGVVLEAPRVAADETMAYRPLTAILDHEAALPADLLEVCCWAADYYFSPIGEVVSAALPPVLRQAGSSAAATADWLALTAAGVQALPQLPARARRVRELLQALAAGAQPRKQFSGHSDAVRRALAAGWVEMRTAPPAEGPLLSEASLALNDAQQGVWDALPVIGGGFAAALLEGVTGSGKTELYLRMAEVALARGLQVLVLAPEIGLTPQLAQRFSARFGGRVDCYHSGLTPAQRSRTWQRAHDGSVDIVVGTRSAVFLPLRRAGAIIVDEEHDTSYKQQEGFRYSARDVAVVRARKLDIPIVLGSATPSLESAANAAAGRYRHLQLPLRAHGGAPPRIGLIDLRRQTLQDGIAEPLLQSLERHLRDGGQALLFQNRRGYAPTLLCHDCGWSAQCRHCDARMVLYRGRRRLLCHHCGASGPAPQHCPECGGANLIPLGQGTERIEEALLRRFPGYRTERFDSDRLARAGAIDKLFTEVRSGAIRILVGTQVLAKGHDFAGLSFAGIVDADQAFYGNDFRALERVGALIVQVAGRVGRAGQPGEVLLQTHQPDNPLLRTLIQSGYPAFCQALLAQRRAAGLPPYAHLLLLRAESRQEGSAQAFLQQVRGVLASAAQGEVDLLGPAPASMERRAGYFRAQLLLRSASRAQLHRCVAAALPQIEALPAARRQRWSIDVDPVDLF